MIDCNQSLWDVPCTCMGMNLRWQTQVVNVYIEQGFNTEQQFAIDDVLQYTESLLQCVKIREVFNPTDANMVVQWIADDAEFLGSTELMFSGDRMVMSVVGMNLGHFDGTYSTLYTDIDDFATVFWHELLHALGIDDHAPQNSGNLMEPTHTGEIIELGDWDMEELDDRYCEGTGGDMPLFLSNSTIQFRCELVDSRCRLVLL